MDEILFLSHRVPWPANRGDKIRSNNILKRLIELGQVHVCAFTEQNDYQRTDPGIRKLLASLHVEKRTKSNWNAGLQALRTGQPISLTGFHSPHMYRWVRELLDRGRIKHIFCFSGQMAQYVPKDFQGRFIMDFVDVDSSKFASYSKHGNPMMRWINAREARKLAEFERKVATRSDASLFVSDAEADLFRNSSGLRSDKIFSLSNGIDTIFYDPGAEFPAPSQKVNGPVIAFTGQMDYRPNVEAVCDFAANAMPQIIEKFPSAKFVIVGRNPTPTVRALGRRDDIIVTGEVEDVRSWLSVAQVVVAPLRIARGIQNKVLEAMAMAKPVVASTAAAEGIFAVNDTHLVIAPNAAAEAQSVIALLSDHKTAQRIGNAARSHVINHYGWAHQLRPLDSLLGIDSHMYEAAE